MGIFNRFKSADTVSGPVEYIIAGLGNPGSKYLDTRHNAGFITADMLACELGFEIKKLKFKSLCGETTLNGKRCLIMKPQTFMNLSGQAVTEAMRFYKIPPERTIIVFDDVSLEPSHLRVRRKGSDGGHNGMKNIIYLSGSDMFPRVKIGVGKKPSPEYDLADWVLSRFTEKEIPLVREAAQNACECLKLIVSGDIDGAMSAYNNK